MLFLFNHGPCMENKPNCDPSGRKREYVQLLELWPMAKLNAQIWQF